MNPEKLGPFIAERRRELGMTQALLAEKLHVTDKAVSRWERGIGLPDINSIETLADALEVSLMELMQARRNEKEVISTKEAERLIADTLQYSKSKNKISRCMGIIILSGFTIISIVLMLLLISDWEIIMFSVGSIITGLIAWGIPVWQLALAKVRRVVSATVVSMGFALLSLMIQFLDIANEVHTGDWSAIADTIDGLNVVIILFVAVTILLNIAMGSGLIFSNLGASISNKVHIKIVGRKDDFQ